MKKKRTIPLEAAVVQVLESQHVLARACKLLRRAVRLMAADEDGGPNMYRDGEKWLAEARVFLGKGAKCG